MTRVLLTLLACALAVPAAAQTAPTVLDPLKNLAVLWDPPIDAPENRPTGYTFETFAETLTGVTITTYTIAGAVTSADIPVTSLPKQPFMAAVRAFREVVPGSRLLSERSNTIGPFVLAGAPTAPANFRRGPAS